MEKGLEKGKELQLIFTIQQMLLNGFSVGQIAQILLVPVEYVQKIAENTQKQ
ncbi:MAG: hypothetical protein RMJ97_09695 [Raineya sp.]|nr:hypothetical protein [Raineya sp.]MDW8297138.1 hypothetical protein [Raineya sp.]